MDSELGLIFFGTRFDEARGLSQPVCPDHEPVPHDEHGRLLPGGWKWELGMHMFFNWFTWL